MEDDPELEEQQDEETIEYLNDQLEAGLEEAEAKAEHEVDSADDELSDLVAGEDDAFPDWDSL